MHNKHTHIVYTLTYLGLKSLKRSINMTVINVLTPAVMLWVYIASPKSTFGHVTVISIVSPTQAFYPES